MKGVYVKMSIDNQAITIYNIEKTIYQFACESAQKMLKSVLEMLDNQLMLERDRTKYRHKGKKKTTLKTIMGEVEYERAIYQCKGEDGKSFHVYLLDEILGFNNIGFVSEVFGEKLVELCCDLSYRKSSKTASGITGQSISAMGAWNVVQKLGERVNEKENHEAKLAKNNRSVGQENVKLLFEEQDGNWLNLQGADRKKYGKKHEMKIAIAYKGAVKTGGGKSKPRYNLVGKVACANFEESSKFYARKEGVIGAVYNRDEIQMRVLNGDGASWLKRSVTDETVHFQLDTYHRNIAITKYVKDENARKIIRDLLYSKQIDLLLEVIEAYSNSCGGREDGEKEKEDFLKLLTYFKNNKDGLVSYHRRELDLPPPPDGIEYRRCGAMESNVFSIIGQRMKRNRTNWSVKGGNNLARFLTLKSTGKLHEVLGNISSSVLPQKYEEKVQVALSSSKVPKSVGKGYDGVKQSSISNAPSWVKNILSFNSIQNTTVGI
jgi:hypothetical protein